MNSTTTQIVTAVLAASAAALVAGLLTNYLTKKATIESVAKGETPLPADATPTTKTGALATPEKTQADIVYQATELAKTIQPNWI